MVLVELVVEEWPVRLALHLLTSLAQSHRLLGRPVPGRLGTQTCPPVNQSLFQFVNTSLRESLWAGGRESRNHYLTSIFTQFHLGGGVFPLLGEVLNP